MHNSFETAPPSGLEEFKLPNCQADSQRRFVHQSAAVTVKALGLPQHLQQSGPILWTNTPQRSAPC